MKVVLQRVSEASVRVKGKIVSEIGIGFVCLVGIETADDETDLEWLVEKILNLRVFGDENGAMNLSLPSVDGDILVVSQFTLHASTKKGNRPSFIKAAKPQQAQVLYDAFVKNMENQLGKKVETGIFGAMMEVSLINDGPVTILIDSKNRI